MTRKRRVALPKTQREWAACENILVKLAYYGPFQRLPRGPHKLTPAEVATLQRSRMIRAMAEAVRRYGYQATTVAQVIELAGVSRRVFYGQFVDKADCFLWAVQVTRAYLGMDWSPQSGDTQE